MSRFLRGEREGQKVNLRINDSSQSFLLGWLARETGCHVHMFS